MLGKLKRFIMILDEVQVAGGHIEKKSTFVWLLFYCKNMTDLKTKLQTMDIELIYKGKVLVDLNKVLEIVDAEKPQNSTDVLKQSMEEMQACLQKVRRESL